MRQPRRRAAVRLVDPQSYKRPGGSYGSSPRTGTELKGGAKLSIDEQNIRVRKISETMLELGHSNHSAYYDHQSQRIKLKSRPSSAGKKVDLDVVATRATERPKAEHDRLER